VGAPDLLARLSALGVRLTREGDAIRAVPRSALTDEARSLIRAHKGELLAALNGPRTNPKHGDIARQSGGHTPAETRQRNALAFLETHPNVRRACFVDVASDPAHIILTVALREPWGALEVLVKREKFDRFALMELSLRYPDTVLLDQ
jgi:hypothetical protein